MIDRDLARMEKGSGDKSRRTFHKYKSEELMLQAARGELNTPISHSGKVRGGHGTQIYESTFFP